MNKKNRRLNIGIVCYPTRGGSGVVAVELAHSLASRGHDVHVVSYDLPVRLDTLRKNVHFHPVMVPDYPLFEYPPYCLSLAARLAEVVCEFKLDVIHAHYAIPHAVSAWLARKMANRDDLALVTTLHGTDITIVGNDPSYLPITQWSLEIADRVTVVSNWLALKVQDILGCDCRTEVVYNFVDPEVYKPDKVYSFEEHLFCGSTDQGKRTPVLMHMSNFRPVKRIGHVVETFLRVRQQIEAQLVMVGDGPERANAERRLKSTPFASDVHFLGMKSDAENILPCADLFLLPSNAESFGLVALEAMACEVPVIGARVGGLPEVVQDGITGRLLEPEDIEGMSQACIELLNDPEKLKQMGKAARKRASEQFPESIALDHYEQVYWNAIESVLKNGPRDNGPSPVPVCEPDEET